MAAAPAGPLARAAQPHQHFSRKTVPMQQPTGQLTRTQITTASTIQSMSGHSRERGRKPRPTLAGREKPDMFAVSVENLMSADTKPSGNAPMGEAIGR
jgi:hypothetical protein